MSKNTPNQSSGGGKTKSQKLFSKNQVNDDDDFTESLYIKIKPINPKKNDQVNDDDDFAESLYIKIKPINPKKNASRTISSPGATLTGEVKTKKYR
jgi:hypothetical protein